MLTETEKAYLAGLIDGEGCIMIHRGKQANGKPRHQLRLDIAQTDRPFFEEWIEHTGVGRISTVKRRSRKRATCYHWVLHDRQAEVILRAVRPYLRIKHTQADIAFEFMESRRPRKAGRNLTETDYAFRDDCYLRLRDAKN